MGLVYSSRGSIAQALALLYFYKLTFNSKSLIHMLRIHRAKIVDINIPSLIFSYFIGRTSFFGKKSGPLNGVDGIYDAQIIHAFQSDTSGQILQLLRDYEPTHLSKVRNEKGETLLHLAVQKGKW